MVFVNTFDGYIRVSRVNGRSGAGYRSPEDQLKIIQDLAQRYGVTLGEIVREEDVSGTKPTEMREIGRLVKKIHDGESGGIIVWNVKRYSRSYTDGMQTFFGIFDHDGRLIAEDFDQTGQGARTMLSMRLEDAERDLKEKRATWERSVRGAINHGIYVGATPVGYDKGRTTALDGTPANRAAKQLVKNGDAPAVENAFRIRANGGSWSEVARSLTEAGVKTATGQSVWSLNSVRSLISHPVYKGELKNGHVHQFTEYVIVEPSTWAKAQVKAGTGKGRKDAGSWAVLGGMVFCAGCGHRMAGQRDRQWSYYRCPSAGVCTSRARIPAEELEGLVVKDALAYLGTWYSEVGVGKDADTEKLGGLEIERDEAQRRFAAWEATSDPLDPGYAEKKQALRDAVQAAEAAIIEERAAAKVFPTAEELAAVVETGSVEEQRQILRRAIIGITVWRKGAAPEPGTGVEGVDETTNPHVRIAWRTLVA